MVVSKLLATGTLSLDPTNDKVIDPIKVPAYGDLIALYIKMDANVTLGTGDAIKSNTRTIDLIKEIKLKEGPDDIFVGKAVKPGIHTADLFSYMFSVLKHGGEAQRITYKALASGSNSDQLLFFMDYPAADRTLFLTFVNLGYVTSALSGTSISIYYEIYAIYQSSAPRLNLMTQTYIPETLPATSSEFDMYKWMPDAKTIACWLVLTDADDRIDRFEIKISQGTEKTRLPVDLLAVLENYNIEAKLKQSVNTEYTLVSPHVSGQILLIPPLPAFVKTTTGEYKLFTTSNAMSLMQLLYLVNR
ncbi:MAG: hypothetical protein QXZ17_10905 [Nitrososphaerota archaeon]